MRVLICETDWTMATLSHELKDAAFLLTRAESEDDFISYLAHGRQDALVLPMNFAEAGCITQLRGIHAGARGAPIIVLADKATGQERAAALEAGADDILPTTVSPELLAARVRTLVLRAHRHAAPQLQVGAAVINVLERRVSVGATPVRLSPLEYEIFEALALRAGRPLSQERLMDQLYAWDDEPDSKIIRVYLSKIRRKLMAAGAPGNMIETRWGHGYNLVTDAPEEVAAKAA